MNTRLRKIITVLFLMGFAVTAPIVVLATKGYRYNWNKGRLEKTGIMMLDSIPSGANIHVNGKPQPKTTPASLFRLLPDDYEVRLEKAGYLTWKKILKVKSGETTFTKDVVLFKDSVPKLLEAGDVTDGVFSADGQMAALLRRGDDWLELAVYRRKTGASALLGRFSPDKYSKPKMIWSPNGDYLLFLAELEDGARELLLYPMVPEGESVALHRNLPPDTRLAASWATDGSRVVIVTGRGVFSADPGSGTVEPAVQSPRVQDAAAVGRELYLLETEADKTVLEKTPIDRRGAPETVADLPAGQYVFTYAGDGYLILTDHGAGKSLLVERRTGKTTDIGSALHAAWERNGSRLLLWNDYEISVYDPVAGQRRLVTRLGAAITGAAWYPSGQNIIYSTPDSILSIELDDRDRRNVFDLAKFTDVNAFFIEPSGKAMLFIGAAGNQRGIYERDL